MCIYCCDKTAAGRTKENGVKDVGRVKRITKRSDLCCGTIFLCCINLLLQIFTPFSPSMKWNPYHYNPAPPLHQVAKDSGSSRYLCEPLHMKERVSSATNTSTPRGQSSDAFPPH